MLFSSRWLRACGFSVCAIITAHAAPSRNLTVDESRELVLAALPESTTKLPEFNLDPFTVSYYPDFCFFEGQWNSTGDVSPVAGHYAVDSRTGDVWNGIICREYKTPRLRVLQSIMRKRIGLTQQQYRKIRRLGPECE